MELGLVIPLLVGLAASVIYLQRPAAAPRAAYLPMMASQPAARLSWWGWFSSARLPRRSALPMVYGRHMSRTNVDINDEACAAVMRRYRLATKREAVNLALRLLAAEPLRLDEARSLRGSGWVGDLDEMRRRRETWS